MKTAQYSTFRKKVLAWYRKNRHDLPWRNTHDPYKILVSEVMLQQTQVDRVRQKWPEFLKQFPTVKALASASSADVIRAWKGMGYNRRALYLQKTAQAVMERFGGKFPQTLEELHALPGVGEYTARALSVFAFGKCYIAPDVNVLRILRRSFSPVIPDRDRGSRNRLGFPALPAGRRLPGRNDIPVKELIAIGDAIVTPKTAYDVNQALMDLGRTVCTAKNPKSALCPLHEDCSAGESDQPKRVKRTEPMFAGVPRRIWRGRVVEVVRHAQKPLKLQEVLKIIGVESDPSIIAWFETVAEQLEKESLINIKKVRRGLLLSL